MVTQLVCYLRNVVIESAKEGVAKKIIVVGTDPKDQSTFVVFSFNPKTKCEQTLGQVPAQMQSVIIQFQGEHSQANAFEHPPYIRLENKF